MMGATIVMKTSAAFMANERSPGRRPPRESPARADEREATTAVHRV